MKKMKLGITNPYKTGSRIDCAITVLFSCPPAKNKAGTSTKPRNQ